MRQNGGHDNSKEIEGPVPGGRFRQMGGWSPVRGGVEVGQDPSVAFPTRLLGILSSKKSGAGIGEVVQLRDVGIEMVTNLVAEGARAPAGG